MIINNFDFKNAIEQFNKIEERGQFWVRARMLLERGFETEAYVLILATWNFAGFRYTLKKFDIEKFELAISKANKCLGKINCKGFSEIDFSDQKLVNNIKEAYSEFKNVAGQTGASKMLSIKNPSLFIMWDTKIRKMYKINNESSPDDYIDFLKKMKDVFSDIDWADKNKPLAKAIDEYNYIKANY